MGCFVQDEELLEGTQVKVMDEFELRKRREASKEQERDHDEKHEGPKEMSMVAEVEKEEWMLKGPHPGPESTGDKSDKEALREAIALLARRMDEVVTRVNGLSSSVEVAKRDKSQASFAPAVSQRADAEMEEEGVGKKPKITTAPPGEFKHEKSSSRTLPPMMKPLSGSPTPTKEARVKAPADLGPLSPQEPPPPFEPAEEGVKEEVQGEPVAPGSTSKVPLLPQDAQRSEIVD